MAVRRHPLLYMGSDNMDTRTGSRFSKKTGQQCWLLATACFDGRIRVWDFPDNFTGVIDTPLINFVGHALNCTGVRFLDSHADQHE